MDKTLVNSKFTLVFSLVQEHRNPWSCFVTACPETHLTKNAQNLKRLVVPETCSQRIDAEGGPGSTLEDSHQLFRVSFPR